MEGFVKINVDGATFRDENCIGIEIVIRDRNGQVMLSCAEKLPTFPTPEFAEALAIVRGMALALDAGFTKVQLEGDAKVILEEIRQGTASFSPHGHIIDDARALMQCFESISFCFVCRDANKVPHILASFVKSFTDMRVWMEDAPPQCYSILISDCNIVSD